MNKVKNEYGKDVWINKALITSMEAWGITTIIKLGADQHVVLGTPEEVMDMLGMSYSWSD